MAADYVVDAKATFKCKSFIACGDGQRARIHSETEHRAEGAVRPLWAKAKLEAPPSADSIKGVEPGPERASAIHKRLRLKPRRQHAVKSLHNLRIDDPGLCPEPEALR